MGNDGKMSIERILMMTALQCAAAIACKERVESEIDFIPMLMWEPLKPHTLPSILCT